MTARGKLTTLALACAVAVALLGASGSAPAPAAPASPAAGRLESDWRHGTFWRPAGSAATRPAVRLERVAWRPTVTSVRHAQPDALAAMRAVVRLAASD